MGDLIAVGACIGLTVVVMILMLGQSRVAFAMARDGLLPTVARQGAPDYGTPYRITLITGVVVAVIAGVRRPHDAGRPGQHRHAVRLRAGQRRRAGAASYPARPAARLPGAGSRPSSPVWPSCCAST